MDHFDGTAWVPPRIVEEDRLPFDENEIEIFEEFLKDHFIMNYILEDDFLKFNIQYTKFSVVKLDDIYNEPIYAETGFQPLENLGIPMLKMAEFLEYLEKKIKYIQSCGDILQAITSYKFENDFLKFGIRRN